MILLDVNVVLAAHRADHPHHDVVRPWFDALLGADDQFTVPDVVWASFIRISTNRRIFELPTPVGSAFEFMDAVRSHPNHVSIAPGEEHLVHFKDLCVWYDVAGDLAADAYVAAIAIEQGCSVASLDRDFARFDGIDWVRPGLG